MISNSEIIKRFNKSLTISKSGNSRQWDNTRRCQEFYSGDNMLYQQELQYMTVQGRKQRALIQFNKIMPFVDAVAGFMAQNRRQVKYVARIQFNLKQEAYTKHANAVKDYVRDHADADQLETEQDQDMLICGYGAVDTDMSYIQGNATTCPNGEILMNRLDPRTVFFDPVAKRKNLNDRRWCGYWQDYDLQDALALFDGSTQEEFGDATPQDNEENYYYDPYGGVYDKVSFDQSIEWADKSESLVRIYNFQWFEYEKFWQADNPIYQFQNPDAVNLAALQLKQIADEQEGYPDMFVFDPMAKVLTFDKEIKTGLTEIFGKFIQPVAFKRKRYYTAVISGKKVFTSFSSVCQTDFSIQFKTGSYDATRKIWIGMVNNMMEPQLYHNKALTELMFTIASNSKGGVIVEKGAVEDIQEFEQKYASTTAVVEVNEGAISGQKIMPKGQNVPMTGLDTIITLTDAAISDAAGVDKSFLGSRESAQETGILYKRRIRQVVSTLAKYFDSITLFQKNNARLLLDFIRIWSENNQGMEIELVEDDGNYASTQITADPFMCEYGITIQEAPQTPEDKEETAVMIGQIGDKVAPINPQGALAIYATAIKHLNLDAADTKNIVEALQPQQPAIDPNYVKQLEEQVKLLSSETNKADVQQKLARGALDTARIQEVNANIKQKAAATAKAFEEAQKTDVETHILRTQPPQNKDAQATVTI